MRGSSQAAPDERSCAPIHTAKKTVMSKMHPDTSMGSGSSPLRAPAVGPPVTRPALPCTQARSPPPNPPLTPPGRAQLVAATPRGRGPLLPLFPRPSPPPPPPLWLTLCWPQSRKPRRRALEKRYKRRWDADKVPAAESSSGRVAAAQEKENAEPAGPTDALTIPQFALPPRSSLCRSGEPAPTGSGSPLSAVLYRES